MILISFFIDVIIFYIPLNHSKYITFIIRKKIQKCITELNRITTGSSNCTSGYKPPEIESTDSNRYLYNHVRSSVIPNSPKVEIPQMSMNEWLSPVSTLGFPMIGLNCWRKKSLEAPGLRNKFYRLQRPWRPPPSDPSHLPPSPPIH